jgi:hypothetical protein
MYINAKMRIVSGTRGGGMGKRSGEGNSSMIYMIHSKKL